MSIAPPRAALAPFQLRSFRFQWPADLCTSCAFEMETLILGWYVLVETQSVFMLTIYASMQHVGTLLGPMFGVIGDRVGQRKLLSCMRALYGLLAGITMTLALTGHLHPYPVLAIAAVMGMVRPSDNGMRTALTAETVPKAHLISAMGIQRTTQDSARIAGALSGAGLMGLVGMGPAYVVVFCLYLTSFLLTTQTGAAQPDDAAPTKPPRAQSPWRDLKEGLSYVCTTPYLMGTLVLALLLNMTAFPLANSLQPYIVKEVFGGNQATLGYMIACSGSGAVFGSLVLSRFNSFMHPSRLMIYASIAWFLVLILYTQMKTAPVGMIVLFFSGIAQGTALVTMVAILLRNSDPKYRGRIMGVRMLAIYSNMPGILLAGFLIPRVGFAPVAAAYCVFGILATCAIVYYWRAALWSGDAPANAHSAVDAP